MQTEVAGARTDLPTFLYSDEYDATFIPPPTRSDASSQTDDQLPALQPKHVSNPPEKLFMKIEAEDEVIHENRNEVSFCQPYQIRESKMVEPPLKSKRKRSQSKSKSKGKKKKNLKNEREVAKVIEKYFNRRSIKQIKIDVEFKDFKDI